MMKYFDLVNNECIKINSLLSDRYLETYFVSSSLSKIIYGVGANILVFDYDPNRYNYGKIMILKGIIIHIDNDSKRAYPLMEIVSFLQNECKSFSHNIETPDLNGLLDNYDLFLRLSKSQKKWEEKYNQYLKKVYPWY